MAKSRPPLSSSVLTDVPQRLYDAAEAFYFAGILTSSKFDAVAVDSEQYRDISSAADAALSGPKRINDLGAPPIVNLAFSIELYIKLLCHLQNGILMRGHNLYCLFLALEAEAPKVAAAVIMKHRYSRGDRKEFIDTLKVEEMAFENWRYSHEQEFLVSSADSLLVLAAAFRDTVRELHPDRQSVFQQEHPGKL